MPTNYSILKLVMSATAQTTAKPTDNEYFYKATALFTTSVSHSIAANKFKGGTGTTVDSLAKAATNNGYYQLFINGQKQESAVFSVASTGLTLNTTSPYQTVLASTPFTLLTVNFAPSTAITVTD